MQIDVEQQTNSLHFIRSGRHACVDNSKRKEGSDDAKIIMTATLFVSFLLLIVLCLSISLRIVHTHQH
jgi:hypothetical protein